MAIKGCNGFEQLGAQAQVPFPIAVVNEPKILAHILRQLMDLAARLQRAIGRGNHSMPVGPVGWTAAQPGDQRLKRVASSHAFVISSTASSSFE
ncbi:hypothetical protein NKH19_28535 [Mesorhizobium sp. M1338]|uniref:hypothetical protein n=1 Tax=unclassified Mesorhizobium TaxID=325217 RepID=UPI003339635F